VNAQIKTFFDPATWTLTHVVYDRHGGRAAIIDPVLDYDPKAGRTTTTSADEVLAFVEAEQLGVDWILETHAHADHVSAGIYLRSRIGGDIAIGAQITLVQATFARLFNLGPDFVPDGSQFQRLFRDGERFRIGELEAEVLLVPGHTPACIAFKVGNAIFIGDTLFAPDVGTARCDFPGGDARTLYRSARRLLDYPADTRLMLCHDYPPEGREVLFENSVAEQRESNIHIHDGVSEEAYVELRTARDRTLSKPVLILPSIQLNIRAGAFPPAEDNGVSYLKIPLNLL
jgi:glyoxylase-like metal-dependent hydrolase (beta-lactamase superfamily II)